MSNEVFRKKALDRLSSPEQLDLMIPVTSRKFWLIAIAAVLVVFSILAWSLLGTIQEKDTFNSIIIDTGNGENQTTKTVRLLLVAPFIDAQSLQVGMRVSLQPSGTVKTQATGVITGIDAPVTSFSDLLSVLKDESLVAFMTGNQPVTAVYCSIDASSTVLPIGHVTMADVILSDKRPISYIFPDTR